jgi:uncharacterized membrane protein
VESSAPALPKRERLASIDILRGAIMAIMAIDHVRDYFTNARINWMDPAETRPELLMTRWFAQFCAPAFFLLAGMGAYLSLSGGKPRGAVARFLFLRGLVLIVLDLTVVRVAWDFNLSYEGGLWFIVLTALGVSMIVLAGLVYLPMWSVLLFSALIIGGHNLFDHLTGAEFGKFEWLWILLKVRGGDTVAGVDFYISYTLVPWIGIMALGYGLGPILTRDARSRRRWLFFLGLAFTLSFVVLRGFNLYGDPRPWVPDPNNPVSYWAFLRTKKYPASLQHVLMTVGPLLIILAALDRVKKPNMLGRWLIEFGRAPLFFYILHLYVIHFLALVFGVAAGFQMHEFLVLYNRLPEGWGFNLPQVYMIWILVLVVCHPVCVWFDGVKRRSKSVWLSYL